MVSAAVPPINLDLSVFAWILRGMYEYAEPMLHYTEDEEGAHTCRFCDQKCLISVCVLSVVKYRPQGPKESRVSVSI